MLSNPRVVYDQVWYEQLPVYNRFDSNKNKNKNILIIYII